MPLQNSPLANKPLANKPLANKPLANGSLGRSRLQTRLRCSSGYRKDSDWLRRIRARPLIGRALFPGPRCASSDVSRSAPR
ncbi:hypothetical protein EYF80_050649 [Liparis tanakae]|uniref:Uncharacterized protein n=1 Tax=Liparis tanakae TaxID=230148 RepID=A0A4Z2FEK7_9TELE|nr:hypothetical protein EYF80_050649 [Liparis tanakae]